MICRGCEGNSAKRQAVLPGYCEVCGFGFLRDSDGNPSSVTCLHAESYQEAVNRGLLSGTVLKTKPVVASLPGAGLERASSERGKPDVNADALEGIYQAVVANPGLGKSKLLERSGRSEQEWPLVIKELLAQGRVRQEGERRGATYFAKLEVVGAPKFEIPVASITPAAAVQLAVDPNTLGILYRTIKANPGLGKSKLLERSKLPESEWPLAIKELLARGHVQKRGEWRGEQQVAVYFAKE